MCRVQSSELLSRSYRHYWSDISYTTGPNPVNGRFVSATATLLVRLGVCSFGPRKVCARCWIGDDDERRMGIVGCRIREILGMTRTDSR